MSAGKITSFPDSSAFASDLRPKAKACSVFARGGKRREHRQPRTRSSNELPTTRVYFVYKFWIDIPADAEGEACDLAKDAPLCWNHSAQHRSYEESDCINLGI